MGFVDNILNWDIVFVSNQGLLLSSNSDKKEIIFIFYMYMAIHHIKKKIKCDTNALFLLGWWHWMFLYFIVFKGNLLYDLYLKN